MGIEDKDRLMVEEGGGVEAGPPAWPQQLTFSYLLFFFFSEKVEKRAAGTDVCWRRKQRNVFVLAEAAGPTVGE